MSAAEASNKSVAANPSDAGNPPKHTKRCDFTRCVRSTFVTFKHRPSFSARVVEPEPEDTRNQEGESDGEEAEDSFDPDEDGDFLEGFPDETQVSCLFLLFVGFSI
jgi:hypothetical protein